MRISNRTTVPDLATQILVLTSAVNEIRDVVADCRGCGSPAVAVGRIGAILDGLDVALDRIGTEPTHEH